MSSLVSKGKWAYIDRFFNKGLGLVVFSLSAMFLGQEEFGLVVICRLIIDYLDGLADQGLGTALIQNKSLDDLHVSSALFANFFLGFTFFLFVFCSADIVSNFYGLPELVDVIQSLAVFLILSSLTRVQVALLIKYGEFKKLAYRSLVMSTIGSISAIFFLFNGYGVWSLVYQQLISSLIGLIFLFLFPVFNFSLVFSWGKLKELYSFSFNVVLDQQISFFSKRFDEFFVSILFDASVLGMYGLCKKYVVIFVDVLIMPISNVLLSDFSTNQDRKNYLSYRFSYLCGLTLIFFWPIAFVFSQISPELLALIAGEDWVEASDLFSLFFITSPLLMLPIFFHTMFFATGRPDIPVKSNLLRMGLMGVFVYVFKEYGVLAIGFSFVVKEVFGLVLDYYFFKKTFKSYKLLTYFLSKSLLCFFSFALIFLVFISFVNIELIGFSYVALVAIFCVVPYIVSVSLYDFGVVLLCFGFLKGKI